MSTSVMKPEEAVVAESGGAPPTVVVPPQPQPPVIPQQQQPQPPVASMGGGGGGGGGPSFISASLYIGDLLPEVNEGLLFEIFNAVGPVSSIRVCRDAVTRRSLGYAYVNYHQTIDAERALESMNFTEIKGKPCRIMWSQRDPSVRRSGVGNIFVKNLHENIDNKQLYDTFGLFGNILSCKVVCDRATGLSKGYGYVHYETNEAARSAIEKLDGMLIDGREVQVGQFMRRDNRPDSQAFTNCFVKNIPYEWDEKRLEDEFMKFGEIVSVSISMGRRKRDKKKAVAAAAVTPEKKEGEEKEGEKKNGTEEEKPVEEAKVDDEPVPVAESPSPSSDVVVVVDDDETKPESLGFGFVNYLNHDSAADAVREMNEKSYRVTEDGATFDKVIYVGRAQKKAERERELRAKYEVEKLDRIAKFQGVNLYVKNLDESVTDDVLREEFGAMGTITSAHVMKEPRTGASRGFGFVCFSTPEDSTRAVNEMNGKLIAGKPVFVALAQRREVRRAQLEAQHGQGRGGLGGPGGVGGGVGLGGPGGMMRGMPMGGPMVGGYGPGAVPMYMPRVPGGPGGMQPSYPVGAMPQMMGGRGGYGVQVPGGQPGVRPGGGYPMQGYGMMPAQPGRGGPQGGGMGGPQLAGGRGGGGGGGRGPGGPMGRGGGAPAGPYGRGGGGGRGGPMHGQPPIKFNQQARNAVPGGMMPPGGPQPIMADAQQSGIGGAMGGGPPPPSSSNEQLTPAALASATPEVQKNMIGERLYPLIHQTQPELAGKITGMLLEMDNSELLHLLESPEALNAKIQEALQVLEAHNAAEDK
ncbi:hypothetical protein ACHAW5_008123 [Stephanodiscus triporus]|uniref:PABP n=1 Tax=Stephanodiscus triporus TaxID=2934178 RepID=A0ABD3NI99_9STRA